MKRVTFFLICLLMVAGATYLVTTWRYQVGAFSANVIRDGKLQESAGLKWAQPLDVPGAPNLHRVSDGLYRGAQPDRNGLANLQKMGVKTVISLRDDNDDPAIAGGIDVQLRHIPLNATHQPTDQEAAQFLKIVTDPKNQPVFVHCRVGADRTGTMCAVYRVAVQGWTRQAAIDEMTRGGFGYHAQFDNLVKYIQTADFEKIKRQAGLKRN